MVEKKDKEGYNFLSNNCCNIVVQALNAWGAVSDVDQDTHDLVLECGKLTKENEWVTM